MKGKAIALRDVSPITRLVYKLLYNVSRDVHFKYMILIWGYCFKLIHTLVCNIATFVSCNFYSTQFVSVYMEQLLY